MKKPVTARGVARDLSRWAALLWVLPCALAAVAYRAVTRFEFAADARFLILDNQLLHDPGGAFAQVTHDYFWSSSGSMIPYWRPLTKLSWWLEWRLFGPDDGAFQLVSVAWFVLAAAGVYALARTLGSGRGLAAIVASVYALHPVAIEPVALLMARSDVVAAAGFTWSVVAFLRWVAHSGRPLAWLSVHLLATVVALGSKEVAVTLPLVLVGFVFLGPGSRGAHGVSLRRRVVRGLLLVAPAAALVALYLFLRWRILAGEDPALPVTRLEAEPLRVFASLGKYLENSWPLSLASSVRDVPRAEAESARFCLMATLAWGVFLGAVVLAWRRDRVSLALLLWSLLVLLPVVITGAINVPTGPGKFALADRWLFHALGPLLCVWARLFAPLVSSVPRRRVVLGLVVVWGGFMLFRSTPDRQVLASEAAMLENEDRAFYLATPDEYRTPEDRCRFEERKAVRALMKNDGPAAYEAGMREINVCGHTPEAVADLLDACVRTGRLVEAEPLADEARSSPPRDTRGHARLTLDVGIVLLARGRADEGARWLKKSLELGTEPCALPWVQLAEAAQAKNALAEGALRLEDAYACGGRRDPSLLLAGATWLVDAGELTRAGELLAVARQHRLTADQAAQAERLARAVAGEAGVPRGEPRRAPP